MNVVKRKKFMIAFGINQIGSILYAVLLGMHDEHYSSLMANSLTTVITFLAEAYLKNKKIKQRNILGMCFVLAGIYLII